MTDHIHLFFPLPRTIAVADLVKEVKTGSSKWVHDKVDGMGHFHWQSGYGIFSVSPGHKEAVVQYIADQPEHHRAVSFQDEYRRLLAKCPQGFTLGYRRLPLRGSGMQRSQRRNAQRRAAAATEELGVARRRNHPDCCGTAGV